MAADTLTADNIAPNAIGSSELADEAVDRNSIKDDAVNGSKISSSAFGRGVDKQANIVGHEKSYASRRHRQALLASLLMNMATFQHLLRRSLLLTCQSQRTRSTAFRTIRPVVA